MVYQSFRCAGGDNELYVSWFNQLLLPIWLRQQKCAWPSIPALISCHLGGGREAREETAGTCTRIGAERKKVVKKRLSDENSEIPWKPSSWPSSWKLILTSTGASITKCLLVNFKFVSTDELFQYEIAVPLVRIIAISPNSVLSDILISTLSFYVYNQAEFSTFCDWWQEVSC